MAECPGGIPDQLYFIPRLQGKWLCTCIIQENNNNASSILIGVTDQKCHYNILDLVVAESSVEPESQFTLEFLNLVKLIMDEDGLCMPTTPREAVDLYLHLTDTIDTMSKTINF